MEKELGFPLFFRHKRMVRLTEAGKYYADEVSSILHDLEQAEGTARSLALHDGRLLNIGFVNLASTPTITEVLRAFRKTEPDSLIRLRSDTLRVLNLGLNAGELDVVMALFDGIKGDSIHSRLLYHGYPVCFISTENPLSRKERISPRDLDGQTILLEDYRRTAPLITQLQRHLLETLKNSVFEYYSSINTLIPLLECNYGIAVRAFYSIAPDPAFRAVPLDLPELSDLRGFDYHIFWNADHYSPAARHFTELMLESYKKASVNI